MSAVALIALLAALAAAARPQALPPVALSSTWSTIPLPATPLGLAEHDGTLWVCGANEMVASSSDSGATWTVRNLVPAAGELLFAFAFPAPGHIEVFGSEGAHDFSDDGGASWRRNANLQGDELDHAVFPDAQTGFAIGPSDWETTRDGGMHWQPAAIARAQQGRPKEKPNSSEAFESVSALAAWDADHAVVLVGDGAAATSDGGLHWASVTFSQKDTWSALRAAGGYYQLFGESTQPDGTKVPVAATSSDGLNWTTAPAPPIAYSACTVQGCRMRGGWVDLRGSVPRFWQVPDDNVEPLSGAWASIGETFCRVSSHLRCRRGIAPWTKAASEPDPLDEIMPKKLADPDPNSPPEARARKQNGYVLARVEIAADGRIRQAIILSATSAAFARQSLEVLPRWRFAPDLQRGIPTAISAGIEFHWHILQR